MKKISLTRAMLAAAAMLAVTTASAQDVDPYEVMHVVPAAGEVTSLSTWTVTFDCEWGLADRKAKFTVTAPEGIEVPSLYSGSNGEMGYVAYLADDKVFTTPGQYTFTIPAGKFSLGAGASAVLNPEMTYEYTITSASSHVPSYTINPVPGTYQTIKDGFTLTFDAETVEIVNPKGVVLYGPEDEMSINIDHPELSNTIAVTPLSSGGNPMELTELGYYTLLFTAGSLKVDGVSIGKALSFRYVLEEPTLGIWKGTFKADPADGSTVESLSHIDITFNGAGTVKVWDYASASDFPVLYDADNRQVTTATVFAKDNLLQISLVGTVSMPGEYRLVIPTRLIKIDSRELAEPLTLTYTIEGKVDAFDYGYELSPRPGSIIGAQEALSITFSGEAVASVENDPYAWGGNAPHFTSADGYWCPSLYITSSDKTFIFTHTYPFEDTGVFEFVIPAGYFTLVSTAGDKIYSKEIKAEYHVTTSAITSINNDSPDAASDVYTITGIRIGSTGDADLPAGIYIVKGKKLIIRK